MGTEIVPILAIFGHVDIHVVIAASTVSVIACSCSSAAPFLRGRLTNIRLAITLETATTLGALSGVFLFGVIPVSYLFFLFAAILLVSVQQMMARRGDPRGDPRGASTAAPTGRWGAALCLDSSYPEPALGTDIAYRV
jgi:uncharacterized membrane protein YfcA